MTDLRVHVIRGSRFLPPGEWLVTVFPDGRVTLAHREQSWQTWGVPVDATEEPS